jgi:hypothetical protein
MFNKILFFCHKVLFHQINAWIVHGQLIDICDEFFIATIDKQSDLSEDLKPQEDTGTKSTFFKKKEDANKTQVSISQLNTSKLNATMGVMKLKNVLGLEEDEKEWNNRYTLRIAMLPQYGHITSTLAERILFIGKAVKVL